jgi:hypothetical protein
MKAKTQPRDLPHGFAIDALSADSQLFPIFLLQLRQFFLDTHQARSRLPSKSLRRIIQFAGMPARTRTFCGGLSPGVPKPRFCKDLVGTVFQCFDSRFGIFLHREDYYPAIVFCSFKKLSDQSYPARHHHFADDYIRYMRL